MDYEDESLDMTGGIYNTVWKHVLGQSEERRIWSYYLYHTFDLQLFSANKASFP